MPAYLPSEDGQAGAAARWPCGVSYMVGDSVGVFKCQMLVSNCNSNKISLELTEYVQIYLLVLVGLFFILLLSTPFLPFYYKDFLSFQMQEKNKKVLHMLILTLGYTKYIMYPLTHTANLNLGKCTSNHTLVSFVKYLFL